MYGVNSMTYIKYTENFEPWYNKECLQENWSFKQAMKDYCRADVELLSKAILKYRKIFKDKFDVDPFRYITLASLCMAIFRGCFLPEKSIVSSEPNKHVSNVCKEWLIHKQIKTTEHPIIIKKVVININLKKYTKTSIIITIQFTTTVKTYFYCRWV